MGGSTLRDVEENKFVSFSTYNALSLLRKLALHFSGIKAVSYSACGVSARHSRDFAKSISSLDTTMHKFKRTKAYVKCCFGPPGHATQQRVLPGITLVMEYRHWGKANRKAKIHMLPMTTLVAVAESLGFKGSIMAIYL